MIYPHEACPIPIVTTVSRSLDMADSLNLRHRETVHEYRKLIQYGRDPQTQPYVSEACVLSAAGCRPLRARQAAGDHLKLGHIGLVGGVVILETAVLSETADIVFRPQFYSTPHEEG
jgi:hypothetical protein